MLITCHPTDIKVYLLGYLKGFLLFFKRYSRIIRNMITMKVLLRIISLGTCSLTSCEHQYIPFECLCYCKISPFHTYHNCHPVVTEYLKRHLNDIQTKFLPLLFCQLFSLHIFNKILHFCKIIIRCNGGC